MIYLFDREKKLQKIIPRKHIINATQTKVRNGIYQLAVEVPIFYEDKKGTQYNYQKSVSKAEFAGHYDDKNRFQLYKIYSRNITANEQGEFLLFDGVHIFFDEAKAMGNIHDRRFRDSEAKAPADVAFNSIGWTVTDYDVTDRHDINFYRASVTDAWNDLISTYGVEFDYELQFDGRKIISKNIVMKKQIGKWTGQRFAYGTNVLTLTQEQDESEVYTAAVGRGRGEETGDGFGPRLEFGDITWSKDGITKPVGQNYIELPSATAEYGFIENGIVKPRIAPEVVFEDIEDKKELADATYYWLLENCLPKATWKTEVARIGNLNLGDTVGVLYKAAGIIKRARVEKIEHNLLDPKLSKLTLGDYRYFNQDKRQKRIDSTINRIRREANSRITQMKNEYTAWFDAQTLAIKNAHEQAVIDANANIQAAEQRMETLINTTRNDWTDTFEAEVAEIYRKADEDYNRIEAEITGVIDSTREEMEMNFNADVQSTREYAEQQAQEKSTAVRTDLETVTSGHQQMLDDLESNVMNIDDFLGDKTVGLNELLYNERMLFEEKLNNVDTWHYNILRGTRFDEGFWNPTFGTIRTDEEIPYYYFDPAATTSNLPYVQSTQEIAFEPGEVYRLSFDWQTYAVRAVDYVFIIASPDDGGSNINIGVSTSTDRISGTNLFTSFGSEYGRYFIEFSPTRNIRGHVRIGANLNNNEHGRRGFKLRLPYLTTTDNTRWLYHQQDSSQNIEEITRRVMQLEDGREEFITKTQYDFETGEIEGTMRNILETVDGRESIIQNHEDWINTNGASVIESAEGFQSKAWLSDIHNPNMITHSDITSSENRNYWAGYNTSTIGISYGNWVRVRNIDSSINLGYRTPKMAVDQGVEYTVSWLAWTDDDGFDMRFDYCYMMYSSTSNQSLSNPVRRNTGETIAGNTIYEYELTFVPNRSDENARFMFGGRTFAEGIDTSFRMRHPKLELGDRATPYYNAYSMFNQRADSIALQVDDQESIINDLTVDLEGITGMVADIEGDYIKQSSLEITPDYAQIGSIRIDGDTVGSLLRVSPSGIDAVAEAMRLSGDLLVDGDITALAVDAIEGNFARLWADEFSAITIDVDDISGLTARFNYLYTLNANIERLVSQQVFSEEVTALVGNFVDVNAGNIVTSGLSANVISSSHINSSNALIEKLFSNSARIDTLISKTHFVNEIKATSIDAVYADLRSVNSEIMDTNILKADWIQGGNALLDKVFANTAMFERMMAKSGFVRTLNTVTIDTDQITIRRYDGVPVIDRGTLNFNLNVPLEDFWSEYINWTGQWYEHSGAGWQTYKTGSFRHEGTRLVANTLVRLSGYSPSVSEWMYVRIRPYGQNRIGMPTVERRILVRNGEAETFDLEVDLGRPTFYRGYFYIEFRKESLSDGGAHADNIVQTRTNRVWQEG